MQKERSDAVFLVLLGLVAGLFVGVLVGSQLPRDAAGGGPTSDLTGTLT